MGDFIQAFADFVGPNSMGELPVVEVTEHEHQRPPDLLANGPRGTSDNPTTIVESIIEELLDPSACSKYIVQSILDELIAAVPCLAAPSPVVAPPPRLPSQPSRVVRGKVQPPTVPPASRPGRLTNQLLYMKRKVMPGIWAHKFTWPFKKPVDAIKLNLPDYHTIIKQPMDFGTVRKRLNNKYYWSASECQEDIRLVFSNCYIYNKPELDISIMGHTLEKVSSQVDVSRLSFICSIARAWRRECPSRRSIKTWRRQQSRGRAGHRAAQGPGGVSMGTM